MFTSQIAVLSTCAGVPLNPGFLGDAASKLDEVFTEPLLLKLESS
jgi:hypothetical protein